MRGKITVLVVDDQPVVRLGLCTILRGISQVGNVVEAANGREAMKQVSDAKPSVVLMDLVLPPPISGIVATQRILDKHPDIRIVAVTSSESQAVFVQFMQAGGCGIIAKGALRDEYESAIGFVMAGEIWFSEEISWRLALNMDARRALGLSAREREVAELIAAGRTHSRVADILQIPRSAVAVHRSRLMNKIGAENDVQIASFVWRTLQAPGGYTAIPAGISEDRPGDHNARQ